MLKESFLEYLSLERNYSDKTVISYGTDIAKFEEYFKGLDESLDFTAVDSDVVRSWVLKLMDEGYEAASVNRKLSSLRSFYRYLLRKKMVAADPTHQKVAGLKRKKPLPVFVREADMDRLLDAADLGEGFKAVRNRLIVEMFYETGMRLSELVGLNDGDVDFSASVIKVTGKRNKQRLIPFGEELREDMRAYLSLRDDYAANADAFFVGKDGKRIGRSTVYLLVRRYLSKVVTLKKKSPHVLRHSFATSMLNNHAELEAVKELLGHESLKTTEIYTHTTFEELKKVYEQAHPRA